MVDEIWDGKSSLIFSADGEQLIAVTLGDGVFYVHIANKDFWIADETSLDNVFKALKKTVPICSQRPFEQLTANPDPNVFPAVIGAICALEAKNMMKTIWRKAIISLIWIGYVITAVFQG